MADSISQQLLQEFFLKADQHLSGDWIVIGGSVLVFLGVETHATYDIDLACFSTQGSQKNLISLMDIAQSIGLPVESINQAAAYFLEKIPQWHSAVVPIYHGKNCGFFRPSAQLFLSLKVNRLSESDLKDCLAMIQWAKAHNESIEPQSLLAQIKGRMTDEKLEEKLSHRLREMAITLKKLSS